MAETKTAPKKKLGSPDHVAWDRNKAHRRRVAMKEVQFSGSMALAIKPKSPTTDLTSLVPNGELEFLALRYCPPGTFPTPGGKYMESHMASIASAVLVHGMPLIDFPDARKTFNFRLRPDTKNGRDALHPEGDVLHATAFRREFGILNRMSSEIDMLAFCGVDGRGRPLRSPWNRRKPKSEEFARDVRVQEPSSWMPNAFVGVRFQDMARLFDYATWKKTDGKVRYACPKCKTRHKAEDFKRAQFRSTFYPDGNFSATCTKCRQRRKYFLDNPAPEQAKRDFRMGFKIAFCEWVAAGGPIKAVADAEYVESAKDTSTMKVHTFETAHGDFNIHLHRDILPEVPELGTVKKGDVIAYALSHLPRWDELGKIWGKQPLRERWNSLATLFSSKHLVGWFQRQWFDNQAVLVEDGIMAFPTKLMGAAAGKVEAQGLWWDLSPAAKHFDTKLGAIVCPPIRIRRWDAFQVNLPGAVRLDASIQDPRFNARPKRSPRKAKPQGKPAKA